MIEYDTESFLKIIFRIQGSVIVRILPQLVITFFMGLLASILKETVDISIDKSGHVILGALLAFLLVFRTNLSYGRYWEGRSTLGAFIKSVRDISMQSSLFIQGEEEEHIKTREEVLRLMRLCMRVLVENLEQVAEAPMESDVPPDFAKEWDDWAKDMNLINIGELTEEELVQIKDHPRPPLLCMLWARDTLFKATQMTYSNPRTGNEETALDTRIYCTIDDNISALISSYNGCMKIATTPFPFPFAQICKIYLVLYTFTLPFAISDTLGWATPFVSIFLAFGYFGIDRIGVEIEEPFGQDLNDLPLTTNIIKRGDVMPSANANSRHRSTGGLLGQVLKDSECLQLYREEKGHWRKPRGERMKRLKFLDPPNTSIPVASPDAAHPTAYAKI